MKIHSLYLIRNLLNNKVYIGQTINIKDRWKNHIYLSNNNSKQYIHRAINKYGLDNFEFIIISSSKTQEDANEAERILILQYNSTNKNYGYNIALGGNTAPLSEETKLKLREATIKQINEKGHPKKGKRLSEEQKQRIRDAQKSLDKDKIYTEEVRKRMSDAHIGYKQSLEQINKRVESIKETCEKRRKILNLRCSIDGCESNKNYYIIEGNRYCSKHGQRMRNKGNAKDLTSEESKIKYGRGMRGKEPYNKVKFSDEQIKLILEDNRSYREIGKDFNVSEKVISRVKKANKYL
jgi:group I intron endonuclease